MTGQLEIAREEGLGIIALNRPEAINALSHDMVRGITRTLEDWLDDDGIRAVLFLGRGPRGFCAGGDVRAMRQLVLEGRPEDADAFFAAEYYMNGLIATYPKPTVALTHGIVMGGGIGIAGHCRYRLSLGDGKWAMPEGAIGFVSDVGINHILAKAPLGRALDFLMTGAVVGAAEAMALGLLDGVVAPEERDAVLSEIAQAARADDIDAALVHLLQRRALPLDPAPARVDSVATDWTDFAAAVAALGPERLKRCSPTSLYAIHASHLASRRLGSIELILAADLGLAQLLCRWTDFAEGVRAVLVDKDQRPVWQPNDFAAIDTTAIDAAITAAIGSKPV